MLVDVITIGCARVFKVDCTYDAILSCRSQQTAECNYWSKTGKIQEKYRCHRL